MTWTAGNETTTHGYKFTYDGLNRMLNAVYGEGTSLSNNTNRFTEKVTGYDKNGNILALQRYGQTGTSSYGLIDNLTFTLNGNQLNRVDDAVTGSAYNNGFEFKDAVKQANEYAYDANGNLTKDLNRNITDIQYLDFAKISNDYLYLLPFKQKKMLFIRTIYGLNSIFLPHAHAEIIYIITFMSIIFYITK